MKKPPFQYSIVIFLNLEYSELVKSFKLILKNKIKWFHSANSEPHITVIEFDSELLLQLYINQIRQYCQSTTLQTITFNLFADFYPYTFYLAPIEISKAYLKKLIVDLYLFLDFSVNENSINPHLTIARKLNQEQIKSAHELFSDIKINIEFSCNAFYLRKFNENTQQHSYILDKIDFGIDI